ncbi:hypothetical protein [Bifidobacterium panos]|uniref:Uncharacterized protein n=1 Tax=Bifidobacterium panos TaxID=2675321 RepID=A0ABX1SY43_9BIFI|nr:hypothetical protein [Bifidobacterium sp. DSM 109963]NMN02766.1 hypothetical protein [Bifidobacterium sp. DSM 109963]
MRRLLAGVVAVLWAAALLDILLVPACATDPLWRLVECVFVFVLVPLLAFGCLEADDASK